MLNIKPIFKWAGNKYQCLSHLLKAFPTANRLIEPFTGSGAIFQNTDYPTYLLAEANNDLVHFFRHLQEDKETFISYCRSFFNTQNNSSEQYYTLRQLFNQCNSSKTRAALFLYLNRHGYNGLCRYNKQGIYNVPFGRYTKPYFPEKEMRFFHQKSERATFIQSDFKETMRMAMPGDLIYCDPPYAPLEQSSNFSAYTQKKFGLSEHQALAQLAKETAARGIPVIISNHDTTFTREQYKGADIRTFQVKRWISCDSKKRIPVNELLAIFWL